ncbi:MAG: hypothetical protein HEP70_19755 [Rhodobiaceae bacterium]|nr:hypothetical protein [Rhodobiaceae bacterium]
MAKIRANRRVRRAGRGALSMVIVLLVGSAVVRLASGTGAAIAREVQPAEPAPQAENNQPAEPDREGMTRMLAAFQQREATLRERERDMEDRMAALTQAEAAIAVQMQALVDAENRLRETLSLADGASETDLTQLTAVYENMKPKEAAALFEEMDPEFAAGFMGRMRADAAAGIMAGLSPQAAYSISAVMAGRHTDVPK